MEKLSGSWLGNYYYESGGSQPHGFEAVFIEIEGVVEGSILDDGHLGEARLFGSFTHPSLSFTKKYDSGASPVYYEGTLSDEGKKLQGTWHITSSVKGYWYAWRQDDEEVPDLQTEDELDQELEDAESRQLVQVTRSPAR